MAPVDAISFSIIREYTLITEQQIRKVRASAYPLIFGMFTSTILPIVIGLNNVVVHRYLGQFPPKNVLNLESHIVSVTSTKRSEVVPVKSLDCSPFSLSSPCPYQFQESAHVIELPSYPTSSSPSSQILQIRLSFNTPPSLCLG